MEKSWVIFDGSNFYNKVKDLLPGVHLTGFDYMGLAKWIAEKKPNKCMYCVGEIRREKDNKKSDQLYSKQQSLFSNLRKQKIEIKLGYLLFSGGVYHEKGVDVQMAADMIYGALKNKVDNIYLISSDTDLLPAIKIVKAAGKKVIYVGFKKMMSRALAKNCSRYILLEEGSLDQFRNKNPRVEVNRGGLAK